MTTANIFRNRKAKMTFVDSLESFGSSPLRKKFSDAVKKAYDERITAAEDLQYYTLSAEEVVNISRKIKQTA